MGSFRFARWIFPGGIGIGMMCGLVASAPSAEPGELNKAFSERLLQIAKDYKTYAQVDGRLRPAPTLCAAPMLGPSLLVSKSDDGATHGKKVYFLFAKDRQEYLGLMDVNIGTGKDALLSAERIDEAKKNSPHQVGQAIVKEAWLPAKVEPATKARSQSGATRQGPTVKIGDDEFYAKEKIGLFIIYKLAENTPDTDHG